jgi:hypothetical protein
LEILIGPQILDFERSLSLSPGPQSSLVLPCKIYREIPATNSSIITLNGLKCNMFVPENNKVAIKSYLFDLQAAVFYYCSGDSSFKIGTIFK